MYNITFIFLLLYAFLSSSEFLLSLQPLSSKVSPLLPLFLGDLLDSYLINHPSYYILIPILSMYSSEYESIIILPLLIYNDPVIKF